MKKDEHNHKIDRNTCENSYNIKRKKYNINTFAKIDNNKEKIQVFNSVNNASINKKKRKVVDFMINRTLIIGFSDCGKSCLMNHFLRQKQQPIFKITKSLYQYPKIKAQRSDQIQPIENYENSTVVFDDILLSTQESKIDLFFTRGRHNINDKHYMSQSYFHLPKNTIRKNSIIFSLFKQFLGDIVFLFHDIAGLDLILGEWNEFCRKA